MVEGHDLEASDRLWRPDREQFVHHTACECGWYSPAERHESAALDAWHDHAAAQEPMTFQQMRELAWQMRRNGE